MNASLLVRSARSPCRSRRYLPEPSERPLHHPPPGQDLEPPLPGRPPDHLGRAPERPPGPGQAPVGVSAHTSQTASRPGPPGRPPAWPRHVRHGGGRTITASSSPSVSTSRCRLRPTDFFPPSYPRAAACSVVLTAGCPPRRPTAWPAGPRPADLGPGGVVDAVPGAGLLPRPEVVEHDPVRRQVVGKARQTHPFRAWYRMALTTSRRVYLAGRPPAWGAGHRARSPPLAVVRSVG